jgi:hypothetical protein
MSRETVAALVSELSLGQADVTLADRFYTEVLTDLAWVPGLFVTGTLMEVRDSTRSIAWPDGCVRILTGYYSDGELAPVGILEMDRVNPAWRDERGGPLALVLQEEPSRTFRLYPIPDRRSAPFTFLFGAPFGVDFPEHAVALIHTAIVEDVPEWAELPIALFMVAREAARESNHRDPDVAEYAQSIASALLDAGAS